MPNSLVPIAVEDEDFMRPDWLLESDIEEYASEGEADDEQIYPLLTARQYIDLNVNYGCGKTGLFLMNGGLYPVTLSWESSRFGGKTWFNCEFLYVKPPKPPLPRVHQKYPVKSVNKKIHRKNQVRKGQVHGGFNKRF